MFINKGGNNMDEFIKDRDEAFASGDIEKVRAYCKKY